MASMLYAHHVPPEGGDTLWSSMRAAFAALSPSLRAFLQPLDAEHDFTRSFPPDHLASRNVGIERYAWARREYPPVAHPLVRTHPETGREGLFVNSGFTTRILGLTRGESTKILELLSEHIQRPEFIIRWRWKPKTLAFWDGVNVTLGLPIVRTSPDHGTALDIAGKGKADPRSMIAAIKMAADIADARAR